MYLALCSQIKDNGPATRIWQPEWWELASFIWMIRAGLLVGRGWEDETYRIKKKCNIPPPLSLLMASDHDLWSYMYIHILDKYLAGCIFPGILTSPGGKEPCFSQAFGYSRSNFHWVLVAQQACLHQVYMLQCPRTHKGVIQFSFLCCHLLADGRQLSVEV